MHLESRGLVMDRYKGTKREVSKHKIASVPARVYVAELTTSPGVGERLSPPNTKSKTR